ncbi:hypothetical protein BH09PSE4_BH09PSE4_17860 [soil metagenome]
MASPTPSRSPISGGVPLMIGMLGGAAIGFMVGEPTACFLIGTALGIAAATAIWLVDRRR